MTDCEPTPHAPARLPGLRLLTAGLAAVALFGAASGTDAAAAAGCTGGDADPVQARGEAITRATLCLINAERRDRHLRPLRLRGRLSAAAQRHTSDMVGNHYFSHTAPSGSNPAQRIRRAGYLRSAKRWSVGEIIGWGSQGEDSPRAIVRAWMNSPPHRKAILTPSYRDAGVGEVTGAPIQAPTGGATYTVTFGRKR